MDVLLAIGDKPVTPQEGPMFPMGVEVPIRALRGSEEMTFNVSVPTPKSRKQPYAEPEAVVLMCCPAVLATSRLPFSPDCSGLTSPAPSTALLKNSMPASDSFSICAGTLVADWGFCA
jgi:hypothetical protein